MEEQQKASLQKDEYNSQIEWLEKVPLYGHKDGLNNMRTLMAHLAGDHPVKAPVIHVAGTNGKGSCCAMLSSILHESGLKVGLYTSPHLVDYTERIQVDGREISRSDMARLLARVRETIGEIVAQGGHHATFFEILTAAAFLYFSEQHVDVIVLETGVGGRLDATNIVDDPVLCVVMSISYDHTKVLGSTLSQIAGEKAGIFREGCPVVIAENPGEAMDTLLSHAKKLHCPTLCAGAVTLSGSEEEGALTVRAESADAAHGGRYAFSYPRLRVPLTGDYQKQNLAAVLDAVAVLREAGFRLPDDIVASGLEKTHWPGRMERLVYKGCPVLLDGAHNPGGAKMLSSYLAQHFDRDSCVLVFSALEKKDIRGILSPLSTCPAVREAVFTCLEGQDATASFQRIWQESGKECHVVKEPALALDEASRLAKGGQIVCAGSLYLVGSLLKSLRGRA